MHADDPDLRVRLLDCACNSADQPTATDGDDDRLEIRHLLHHFEANGSLPCDHGRVIEGVQEGHAQRLSPAHGLGASFVVIGSVQDHLRAEAPGSGHLDQRRHQGHHDLGPNAALGGMVSHRLRVVPGAGGDHAAALFLFAQCQDLVQRAAFLKRPGTLQIVQLEKHLLAGHLRQLL